MVDLDGGAGGVASYEIDVLACVGVVEMAARHDAVMGVAAICDIGRVSFQDVVAGVAAVVVHVRPCGPELRALVSALGCPLADRELLQDVRCQWLLFGGGRRMRAQGGCGQRYGDADCGEHGNDGCFSAVMLSCMLRADRVIHDGRFIQFDACLSL